MAYEKLMNASYPGRCTSCRDNIERGNPIMYDMFNKTKRCMKCVNAQSKIQKKEVSKNG